MKDELAKAMTWQGEQYKTLFLGQSVLEAGTAMSDSFVGVPEDKRIEFPVAEELQLGVSIGLALEGFVPVSVFPRFNFLLRAADQLVNHLDRLPLYSAYRPRVIIRTAVGSSKPLDPGYQHQDDFTDALEKMLRTVTMARLKASSRALAVYKKAFKAEGSSLVVEG